MHENAIVMDKAKQVERRRERESARRAEETAVIDNIGSRMDWKRDHVRALNQHKPCRRVRVARELQLPMLYWPILWKFGGKELTDLLTLACM